MIVPIAFRNEGRVIEPALVIGRERIKILEADAPETADFSVVREWPGDLTQGRRGPDPQALSLAIRFARPESRDTKKRDNGKRSS